MYKSKFTTKGIKKIDYLLYISSFLSLLMIILLLTSSKSISYNIDKTKKNIFLEENEFTVDLNKKYNEIMSVHDTSKESIEAKDRERTDTVKISKKIKIIKEVGDSILKKNKIQDKKLEEIKKIINKKLLYKKSDIVNNKYKLNNQNPKISYIVKRGDNLWKISKKFNISINDIVDLNNIKNPNLIVPGQKILISSNKFNHLKINSSVIPSKKNKITKISKIKKRKKFKFIWPLKGRITSEFGVRRSPYNKKMEFHTGIDVACKLGRNFTAAERGKVIFCGIKGGYGKAILIQHKNGYKTFYAHALLTYVKTGQYVEKNQVIGRVGNTGLSTGPHLHFEIRKYDVAIDPTTLINKRLLFY